MFTEEQKFAPLSFISNMVEAGPVVRELGYPSKRNLRRWIRSWEAGGGSKESIRHKHRYSDEQNRLPLNIILTTAAARRLPAGLWVIPVPICSLAGLMNVPRQTTCIYQ